MWKFTFPGQVSSLQNKQDGGRGLLAGVPEAQRLPRLLTAPLCESVPRCLLGEAGVWSSTLLLEERWALGCLSGPVPTLRGEGVLLTVFAHSTRKESKAGGDFFLTLTKNIS